MNNTALFKGLTIPGLPDLEQVNRLNTGMRRCLFVYSLLASLVSGMVGCFTLWTWKETGQWQGYWNVESLLILLMLGFIPATLILSGLAPFHKRATLREEITRALALRQAARAGEEAIAPLVAPQPTLLESGDLPTSPTRLGPLRRLKEMMQASPLSAEIAIDGGAPTVFLVIFALAALNQLLLVDLLTLMLVPLAIGGFLIAWTRQRVLKKITITVDEQGLQWKPLHWRGPRRTRYLAWQDARAFYTFDYERRSSLFWQDWRIFVLDAPEATLAWGVVVPPRFAQQVRSAEQIAHERLVRLIVTRTGLPLRTLSAAAEERARNPIERIADQFSRQVITAETARATLADLNERPPQRLSGWLRRWSLAIPPLALLALLPFAAWGVQAYRSHQYASLLAQARSHRPLYYAAVIAPDSFHERIGLSGQLASDIPLEATTPAVYGDAAVEVTARFPNGERYADFGLILHTDFSARAQVVFRIDLDGYCALGPNDADPGILIRTDTPDTRPGAPNRLTVLMRGNQYICYVNDTFVAVYHATTPGVGHVGVFVGDGYVLDLANFSDFTVYPL
ncbi:MAG TPA: hypothetical protein VH599_07665 [Ktedonobacterales bacterium]|jgi:hypothetical protein